MSTTKYKYLHTIHLVGNLISISPLSLGSGDSENSDRDILLDSEDKPFIPGTSLSGVVRHYISKNYPEYIHFFGRTNTDGRDEQSQISVSDCNLISEDHKIRVRDGIRLDSKTGLIADGAKFDYEVLEPGLKFLFQIELKFSQDEKEPSVKFIQILSDYLQSGRFALGSGSGNGLGRLKLDSTKVLISEMNSIESIWNRIHRTYDELNLDSQKIPSKTNEFTLELLANLEGSILIGDTDPEMISDKAHIRSGGKAILSGSSLKGVIRSRFEKILNTIGDRNSEAYKVIKYLSFGFTEESLKEDGQDAKEILSFIKKRNPRISSHALPNFRGKLQVEETIIKDPVDILQNRIRIDRFTGGTIESALFDSKPVFGRSDQCLQIKLSLDTTNFPEWKEAVGVLLLVLKDLWTGMLAIGGEKNIGRGRVLGKVARFEWFDGNQNLSVKIEGELESSLKIDSNENWKILESYVEQLNRTVGVKK
ncbi:MAG: hypothetical protein KDK54_13195 [Leptospiraceae bacterium]|nr:hypothetical protein [Leptospiraceae bacterium]